jgi:Family of unknown function (DUF6294)
MRTSEYEAQEREELSAPADRMERAPVELQWLDFYWEVLSSGDCFCRRVSLRLYSDGLGDFSAFTSTTDSGDVWLFKGIALLNVYGEELFRIGQFNGPRMELTAHDYFVYRSRQTNPLIFPQQLFPLIRSVRMHYHC